MQAFAIAFSVNLLVYALAAHWWLAPALRKRPPADALSMLVLFHGLRTFGMTLLAPGAVADAVPQAFREAVAYGDLLSGALGIVAAVLLRRGSPLGRPAAWLFSVVGIADLTNAVVQGSVHSVFDHPLGIGWLAVAFYVPALWVTHAMVVWILVRRR